MTHSDDSNGREDGGNLLKSFVSKVKQNVGRHVGEEGVGNGAQNPPPAKEAAAAVQYNVNIKSDNDDASNTYRYRKKQKSASASADGSWEKQSDADQQIAFKETRKDGGGRAADFGEAYQYLQEVPGWGASGLVQLDWVPPTSLFFTPNSPRDVNTINTTLIIMTLCWCLCHFLIKRRLGNSKYANPAFVSRIVSMIHGGLSTAVCSYTMLLRFLQFTSASSYVKNVCCLPEPPLADEQFAALFTASYFVCDTMGMLFGDYFDTQFLMHHVGALIILGTSLYGRMMGLEIAVGVAILECTNLQLHARWLLSECKYDEKYPNSWVWWMCDTGFLASFFVARMVIGRFFYDCVKRVRNGEKWIA